MVPKACQMSVSRACRGFPQRKLRHARGRSPRRSSHTRKLQRKPTKKTKNKKNTKRNKKPSRIGAWRIRKYKGQTQQTLQPRASTTRPKHAVAQEKRKRTQDKLNPKNKNETRTRKTRTIKTQKKTKTKTKNIKQQN